MRKIINRAIIDLDWDAAKAAGLSAHYIRHFLPRYITEATVLRCSELEYAILEIARIALTTLTRIGLKPRTGEIGSLDPQEIQRVYDREAASYDLKHHMTTHGQDTTYRRFAGCCVATLGRNKNYVRILDLCTGTGLTVQELATVLAEWTISSEIVGLDFNESMLAIARQRKITTSNISATFIKGDATTLVDEGKPFSGMSVFPPKSFDAVTQVFGIGGISNPLAVFDGVLKILKDDGVFFLIDMHQPIATEPGEYQLFAKWLRSPAFEIATYNRSTIPLALNRLWGWRDPTADFYLLPLTTYQDQSGCMFGFEILSMETESRQWWLGVPLMPTAKIIVKKRLVEEKEFQKRNTLLSLINKKLLVQNKSKVE